MWTRRKHTDSSLWGPITTHRAPPSEVSHWHEGSEAHWGSDAWKAARVPVSPGGCRPRGSNSRGGTEGLAQVSYEEERNGSENCERKEVSVSHFKITGGNLSTDLAHRKARSEGWDKRIGGREPIP